MQDYFHDLIWLKFNLLFQFSEMLKILSRLFNDLMIVILLGDAIISLVVLDI